MATLISLSYYHDRLLNVQHTYQLRREVVGDLREIARLQRVPYNNEAVNKLIIRALERVGLLLKQNSESLEIRRQRVRMWRWIKFLRAFIEAHEH